MSGEPWPLPLPYSYSSWREPPGYLTLFDPVIITVLHHLRSSRIPRREALRVWAGRRWLVDSEEGRECTDRSEQQVILPLIAIDFVLTPFAQTEAGSPDYGMWRDVVVASCMVVIIVQHLFPPDISRCSTNLHDCQLWVSFHSVELTVVFSNISVVTCAKNPGTLCLSTIQK